MTSRASRGTTLVELMVALTIFFSMLAVIMSFYVEAQQANRKHEQMSEEYRAAVQATLRLETLLQYARIYEVKPAQVVFTRPRVTQGTPQVKGRWPQYEATATTLTVDNKTGRLILHESGGSSSVLITLWTGQQLSFSGGVSTVAVTIQGTAALNRKPFCLTHDVHVENPGTL